MRLFRAVKFVWVSIWVDSVSWVDSTEWRFEWRSYNRPLVFICAFLCFPLYNRCMIILRLFWPSCRLVIRLSCLLALFLSLAVWAQRLSNALFITYLHKRLADLHCQSCIKLPECWWNVDLIAASTAFSIALYRNMVWHGCKYKKLKCLLTSCTQLLMGQMVPNGRYNVWSVN